MYQSFPLGDKSSVNLRGEYHVENVTTFDRDPPKKEDEKSEDQMDVDVQQRAQPDEANKAAAPESQAHPKSVSFDGKRPPAQPLDPGALYPVFWSLQASFSQPKRLFDPAHFRAFQSGLEATMRTFQSIKPDQGSRPVKQEKQADDTRSGAKRKREEGEEDLANGFNPKYLTSRDLFELEVRLFPFPLRPSLSRLSRVVPPRHKRQRILPPQNNKTAHPPLTM
ncbi:hypothetical protein VTK73DRAFT_4465 [Phialemonium thermophilum]|uniref:Uncharacterized protein n=1 Tax=Phialemonium thermophilum TaxID=223376 RepID=A0ABR3V8K2_9PEZI